MLVVFSIVNVLSCKANKNCYHNKKKKIKKRNFRVRFKNQLAEFFLEGEGGILVGDLLHAMYFRFSQRRKTVPLKWRYVLNHFSTGVHPVFTEHIIVLKNETKLRIRTRNLKSKYYLELTFMKFELSESNSKSELEISPRTRHYMHFRTHEILTLRIEFEIRTRNFTSNSTLHAFSNSRNFNSRN